MLFPFEKEYFTKFKLHTVFIGHPLTIDENYNLNLFNSHESLLNKNIKKVALLPGSRKSEINKLDNEYQYDQKTGLYKRKK